MNNHNQRFFKDLNSILKLSVIEQRLLQIFKLFPHNLNAYLQPKHLELLIKMGCNDAEFAQLCNTHPEAKKFFKNQTQTFGIFCANRYKNFKAFMVYNNQANHFAIICGRYFYIQAFCTAQIFYQDFTQYELEFLFQAIQSHSIHAIQRYTIYLFWHILNTNQHKLINYLYHIIITLLNQRELINLYGSYAYSLMANYYYHWANSLAVEQNNIHQANKALDQGILAIEHAQKIFDKSGHGIYNASFGRGLSHSNIWGVSDLGIFKTMFINTKKNLSKKLAALEDNNPSKNLKFK